MFYQYKIFLELTNALPKIHTQDALLSPIQFNKFAIYCTIKIFIEHNSSLARNASSQLDVNLYNNVPLDKTSC